MAKDRMGAVGAASMALLAALVAAPALLRAQTGAGGGITTALASQATAPNVAAATAPTGGKPVVVAGIVPDEATRAAVLTRLRALYGAERVVDRIEVDDVVAPPNWQSHVVNLLGDDLRQVSGGQLDVNGNVVRLQGEVANEAQRQQLASRMSTALNRTWTVHNGLRVGESKQAVLDQALANRTIEFQSGSANLTAQGIAVLEQMAAAMREIGSTRVRISGHTDNVGARAANVALSAARAETVRRYLQSTGIEAARMSVQGLGPDQPLADNNSAEGRARNRRIEFTVL
ncbi:OOP family OmpA-OmpF porin [Lysobacter ruishenii]|uniref:OOP family OmpA-OmpF porin n=2 Tax=Aerolutibacter ruishenii TaxID=686800 RepID=A0A562M0U8_9GAMM|nr:OOP family OmpA-OmpF porin [Lysobacter ruishenii]